MYWPVGRDLSVRSRREEELARYLRLEYGSSDAGWLRAEISRSRSKSQESGVRLWLQRIRSGMRRIAARLTRTPVRANPLPSPAASYAAEGSFEYSSDVVPCPECSSCGT